MVGVTLGTMAVRKLAVVFQREDGCQGLSLEPTSYTMQLWHLRTVTPFVPGPLGLVMRIPPHVLAWGQRLNWSIYNQGHRYMQNNCF